MGPNTKEYKMNTQRILAFSSSRVSGGGYLETAVPVIASFLTQKKGTAAFIPFASVDSYDDYAEKVSSSLSALPYKLITATPATAKAVIEESDAIIIGGGNTFKLLHNLYKADVVDLIKTKVQNGTPYIGWSAGSNLCGTTICTTNDMPIIQPQSFEALGFFSFQINPHYHNLVMEGFHGETRDQRLEEYLKLNEGKKIVCLPEGTYLKCEGDAIIFDGASQGVIMTREEGQTIHRIIHAGTLVNDYL